MHTAPLLLLSLLVTSALAQESRGRGFGRVTDLDSKPWVGAEVHLVATPHPVARDPACWDTIVLKTDARGQFRAPLLEGYAYHAWAVATTRDGDSYRATELREGCVCNKPILLREQPPRLAPPVEAAMHPSWGERPGLRWRATLDEYTTTLPLSAWLQPTADGRLTLPTWPGERVGLQAWLGDHLVETWTLPLDAESERLRRSTDVQRRDGKLIIQLPAKRTRRMQIVNAKTGAPVAGVTLTLDTIPHDVDALRSDEDGVFELVYADEDATRRFAKFHRHMRAPDYAEQALSVASDKSDEGRTTRRALRAGETATGRLRIGGQPVEAAGILFQAQVPVSEISWHSSPRPRLTPVAADGSFSVQGRHADVPSRVLAVLTPEICGRLSDPGSWARVAPLAVLNWEEGPLCEGDVDLDRLGALEVDVRREDGTPMASTHVFVARVTKSQRAPRDVLELITDRRGRVRLLTSTAEDMIVFAVGEEGACLARLDVPGRTTLQMAPSHAVRVQVIDRQGEPLPNVDVGSIGPTGVVSDEGRACGRICTAARRHGLLGARTDADGCATVLVVSPEGTVCISVGASSNPATVNTNFNVDVPLKDDEPALLDI